MDIEPSSQMLSRGDAFASAGGRFTYVVSGPVCRLYDREELPWPSCSLVWRGKQPSWNRVGKRFVADLAAARCPSYAVVGLDAYGNRWDDVVTLYSDRLTTGLRQWWITRKPAAATFPELPEGAVRASCELSFSS